jgi:hypothetical protein
MHDRFEGEIWPAFFAIVAAFFVFNIAYLGWARRMLGYIEKNHPKAWKELGGEKLFTSNSPDAGIKVLAFLLDRKYKAAKDPALTRMGENLRRMLIGGIAGFALSAAGWVAMFIFSKMEGSF